MTTTSPFPRNARRIPLICMSLAVVGAALLLPVRPGLRPTSQQQPSASTHSGALSGGIASLLWSGAFRSFTGQDPRTIQFWSKGERYVATASSDELSLSEPHASGDSLQIRFEGAAAGREAVLTNPLQAVLNIFTGRADQTSKLELRQYGTARFPGIYAGIDAVYRSNDGELELDFHIAPGADPRKIRLLAGSGSRFEHEAQSNDVIVIRGDLRYRLKAPVAYQTFEGRRRTVAVKAVADATTLRFDLGPYDKWHPLVIDPLVTTYSTLIGAKTDAMYDSIAAITSDAAGNVYVAGLTQFDLQLASEPSFPRGPSGLYIPNPRGPQVPDNGCAFQCGYIMKLNASHQIVYAALIFDMEFRAIAVDAQQNVYVTGHTSASTWFPATPGAFSNDPVGQAFVMKLNADGAALGYSALFRAQEGRGIAVDAQGNAYVVGTSEGPGLPTTPTSLKPQYQSTGDRINYEGFLLKVNPTGTQLVYGTYLGGAGADEPWAVITDGVGGVIVAGSTDSTDFTGLNATPPANKDAFIIQVSADGGTLSRARLIGGSDSEHAQGLASDGNGGFLVSGATQSPDFPTTAGVLQPTLLGERNGWLARLDAQLNVRYSTFFGGSTIDGLLAVVSDSDGNAYASGVTFSADLLTTPDAIQDMTSAVATDHLANAGNQFYKLGRDPVREAFVAAISADGKQLLYGSYLGGYYTVPRHYEPLTFSNAITRLPNGTLYVAGSTGTESFPTTDGGLQAGMHGLADAFLTELKPRSLYINSPSLLPQAIVADASYSHQLTATGGTPPYSWEKVGFRMPDGITLSSTGLLSGTAASSQTESDGYQFTVKVTDAAGNTAYKSLMMNLIWPGNPSCSNATCKMRLAVGQSAIYRPPYLYRGVPPFTLTSSGTLPTGMSIDQEGQISGTPTSAGQFIFSLTMHDLLGKSATLTWDITVGDPNAPTPPTPPPSGGGSTGGGSGNGSSSGSGGGGFLDIATLSLLILCLGLSGMRMRLSRAPASGSIILAPVRFTLAAHENSHRHTLRRASARGRIVAGHRRSGR
jgi:hypothetical protein